MIRKPNFIIVDNHGKEIQEKDAHLLDLTVNDADIRQLLADTALLYSIRISSEVHRAVCLMPYMYTLCLKTVLPF